MKAIAHLALVFVTLLLFGCSKSETENNSAGSKSTNGKKKLIGISVMTMSNPFFVELANAAKEEAQKHGYDVIIYGGEEADKQAKQVRDFITQKVDIRKLSSAKK